MTQRYIQLVLLFLLFSFFPSHFLKAQGPTKCKVGIYIKTIKINSTEESFEAAFYFWLRVDSIDIKRDYTFVRDIEFINSSEKISDENFIEERIDSVNNYYFVNGTFKSSFPYKADFTKFPYDDQVFNIAIENTTDNIDNIIYIADNNNRFINKLSDKNIDILNGDQYYISKLDFQTSVHPYQTNFGDPEIKGFDEYSRLNFSIDMKHNALEVLQKIALPLLVALILAYLVFYIPDEEIGTASGLTVTGLLAAIAFQWTINDSLPKVAYITLIDKMFYLVYFFIFYAMTQTVFTYNLSKGNAKQKILSEKLEWHSRYLFPIMFLIGFCYLIKSVQ